MIACYQIENIDIVKTFKFINKVNSRKHKLVYTRTLSFQKLNFN